MLGRTANGLYWMFRYIERAENTARLIDAGLRMSLTRSDSRDDDWDGVLQSAGVREDYDKVHPTLSSVDAIDYLLRDKANPSSVMSCIDAARNNARMVRTALTRETWEAVNECWIELKHVLARKARSTDLPEIIETIKRRAGLIRGAFHGTMLRDDIYNFARIGTFIERADNTARILDVKYYVLLPAISQVGSSLDNMQWESILRSVSAHRSYGWVYDGEYTPSCPAKPELQEQCDPTAPGAGKKGTCAATQGCDGLCQCITCTCGPDTATPTCPKGESGAYCGPDDCQCHEGCRVETDCPGTDHWLTTHLRRAPPLRCGDDGSPSRVPQISGTGAGRLLCRSARRGRPVAAR